MERWLLLIHIAAAAVWVGGGFTFAVIGLRARRSGDAALLLSFGRTLQYVGTRVLGPAMVVLLLAGIALVFAQARSFTEPWILVAIGGFLIAFALGAGFGARAGIGLARAVDAPSPDPAAIASLVGLWLRGYGLVLAILVIVLWDMVFKPGS